MQFCVVALTPSVSPARNRPVGCRRLTELGSGLSRPVEDSISSSRAAAQKFYAAGVVDCSPGLRLRDRQALFLHPAADQALRTGFSWMGEKLLQVFGIVHVDCDAWQSQNLIRFPRCLRRREVWFKTIVAEAEGE